MDEIVSTLGANYVFFEHWGTTITVTLTGWLVFSAWLGVVRSRTWAARVMVIAGVIIAIACLGATRFVMRYIQPLTIPPGYEAARVTLPASVGPLVGDFLAPSLPGLRPALVFLPGSDVSSYRTNYAPLVNEVLTPVFAKAGFAILYMDKRGIGLSAGRWFDAGFDDRAEDARAAIRFLRAQGHVDAARIVVVGHSQGGWIAQILASDPDPPALSISLAGPTLSVMEQSTNEEVGVLTCAGVAEDEARRRAGEVMSRVREASRSTTWGRLRQFARIGDYRPDAVLRGVRTPLLLLFGENDVTVPPGPNIARLRELFDGAPPSNISVVTLAGASHALRLAARCERGSRRDFPFAPALTEELQGAILTVAGSLRAGASVGSVPLH